MGIIFTRRNSETTKADVNKIWEDMKYIASNNLDSSLLQTAIACYRLGKSQLPASEANGS